MVTPSTWCSHTASENTKWWLRVHSCYQKCGCVFGEVLEGCVWSKELSIWASVFLLGENPKWHHPYPVDPLKKQLIEPMHERNDLCQHVKYISTLKTSRWDITTFMYVWCLMLCKSRTLGMVWRGCLRFGELKLKVWPSHRQQQPGKLEGRKKGRLLIGCSRGGCFLMGGLTVL